MCAACSISLPPCHSPLSFSYLRLHRLLANPRLLVNPRLLADPRLSRWVPALLAALVCQLLVVLALPPAGPDTRPGRRAPFADDTPTLLRWSRTPAAVPAASLQAIPLQGLAALPPPPPSTLPNGAFASVPAAVPAPGPVGVPSRAVGVVEAEGSGLPRQPGEAFRLARQVAQAPRPQQASATVVAVQRRQWWLLPGQDKALQDLWEGGLEQAPPPALGPMPDGVAVRRVAASAAAPLALAALHGRSLLDVDQLWLLWRQGANLWILRGSLEQPPALTDP